MADLTGSTIASSYDQLLALPSGGGDGSTLVALTDGNAGNTFALQVSTAGVKSTGTLEVGGITTMSGDLRLEDDAGGEYFGIGTPATVTTYTLTVPAAVGGSGQALRTSDGSGTLEWYTPETGDITGVTAGTGLSGGGTSGTVTLNVEASQTQITALGTIGTGVWQGTAVDGTYIDLEGTELKSSGPEAITKYLRADGDGTCSWQTVSASVVAMGASITSGTSGSILFVDSSTELAQDNDKLFFDATNFRLGIGTATPSKKLHISGTTGDNSRMRFTDTDNSTSFDVGVDASGGLLSSIGANGLLTYTDGTLAMTVDSSQRVGIGRTPTQQLLEVEGSMKLTASDSTIWMDGTGGTAKGINVYTASDFFIKTNNAEAMRIDSSGNVGIGETSPSSDIGFAKTLHITDANSCGITFEATNYNSWEIGTGTSNEFIISDGGAGRVMVASQGYFGIGGSPTTKLDVLLGDDGTVKYKSAAETLFEFWKEGSTEEARMNLKSSGTTKVHLRANGDSYFNGGNVGIGTTAPGTYTSVQSNLEVKTSGHGGIAINAGTDSLGMLAFAQNGTHRWSVEMENTATPSLSFNEAGTTRVTFDNGGNVGIGTSSPSYLIHATQAGGSGDYLAYLYNSDSGTQRHGLNTQIEASDVASYGLRVNTGGSSDALAVKGDGTVGIRTSDTQDYYYNNLVVNAGDEGGITIVDTTSGQSALAFGDAADGSTGRYKGRVLYDHSTDVLRLGGGGQVPVSITDTSLGIGTTVPVTKLTVEGAVTLKEQAAADSDTAAYGQIWVKTGTPNTLYFTDDAGTDVQLGTGGGSSGVTALSETATVTIDFSSTKLQTLTVTGTCDTLATSNRSAGKEVVLRIYNNAGDYGYFAPTTPNSSADWKEIDQSISSTGVLDGAYGILKLTSWGTADTDVTAELLISP